MPYDQEVPMRSRLLFLSLLLVIALFAVCSASSPSHRPQVLKRTAPPHGGRCDPAGIPGPAYPGCRASYTVGVTSALEAAPKTGSLYVRPVRSAGTHAVRAHPAPAPVVVQTQHSTPPAHEDGYHGHGGCARGYVHDLIVRSFANWSHALAIAERESHCIPTAQNRWSSAAGVFQIVSGTWGAYGCSGSWGSRYVAAVNVAMAACIVRNGGWGPWGG